MLHLSLIIRVWPYFEMIDSSLVWCDFYLTFLVLVWNIRENLANFQDHQYFAVLIAHVYLGNFYRGLLMGWMATSLSLCLCPLLQEVGFFHKLKMKSKPDRRFLIILNIVRDLNQV